MPNKKLVAEGTATSWIHRVVLPFKLIKFKADAIKWPLSHYVVRLADFITMDPKKW